MFHKVDIEDLRSVDPKKYTFSLNGTIFILLYDLKVESHVPTVLNIDMLVININN